VTLKLPSASKLALAEKCAFPWTSGKPWPEQPESPAAKRGNAVHRCAEWHAMGQPVDVAKAAAEFGVEVDDWLERAIKNAIVLLERDRFTWREAEVAMAFTAPTCSVRRAESRFDKRPGEQMLIADLVFEDEETGELVVRDLKTGKVLATPADENHQMRILALAASMLFGASEVRVELAYVGSGTYVNRGKLDALDLEFVAIWAAELVAKLPSRTEPVGGPHCKDQWCPLIEVCDAAQKPRRKKAS
jgi:hypothetical protein